MFQKQKLILYFLLLCCFQISFSQINDTKKDSSEIYRDIQTYSKKGKITSFLHHLIFKPFSAKIIRKRKVKQKNYKDFENKIIRKINIITLDPFGYSEIDTSKKPENWAEKTGNRIHIKTKIFAIQNLLLIRKNKPLDSLLVKESMRLIRTQKYISRIDVTTGLIAKNADSVDITIRILDTWSLIPRAVISNSQTALQLNERNFLGFGHEFNTRYKNRFSDGRNAYNFEYIVPNIKNTFIRTTLNYHVDLNNYYSKSINLERPFYSPFAKWGGGIYLDQQFRIDSLPDADFIYARQNFKYNSQDYWIGHAFRIFKGNTEDDRTTNIIVSGRFLNVKYIESPTIVYDPVHFYTSEKFFLSGIGISSRKFIEDKYIFKNGIVEDVPIGKIYGITGGYQYKNNVGQLYLGCQASYGNYYTWGVLSANLELGTFFDKSKTKQSAISFQTNYFTNLFEFGKWKLRQFIKPQIIIGLNRENSVGDQLTIYEDNGIQEFNSAYYGTKKMTLTLQTQAYSPWNLWGFRLNPYFNYSIAMLGNSEIGFQNSRAYSKIGIGLIITNDYLVFKSFQISLAYYPSIPGNESSSLKTNTFETSDFGFQDFELGKPRPVIFK